MADHPTRIGTPHPVQQETSLDHYFYQFKQRLTPLEDDQLAWLGKWAIARPLMRRQRPLFTTAGDDRNTLYVRIG